MTLHKTVLFWSTNTFFVTVWERERERLYSWSRSLYMCVRMLCLCVNSYASVFVCVWERKEILVENERKSMWSCAFTVCKRAFNFISRTCVLMRQCESWSLLVLSMTDALNFNRKRVSGTSESEERKNTVMLLSFAFRFLDCSYQITSHFILDYYK